MSLSDPQRPSHESVQDHHSATHFIIFLLIIIQLLWFVKGPIPLIEGAIVGPDGYMHLNRVIHLVESGEWFSAIYPRSNAPYGEVQHWTRLMDLILLTGAGLTALFLPFATGLHWWGVFLNPVLHILAVLSLVWMVRPIFDRDQQLLMGGVFLFQPALTQSFLAGRPDHHSFLMLCCILLLGLTYRILLDRSSDRWCVAAGAVAAIAMWTSIESFIALAVCLSVLAVRWLWHGGDWGRKNFLVTSVLCSVSFFVLLVDRGIGQLLHAEYDRYSFVHWSVFLYLVGFWSAIWLSKKVRTCEATPLRRLGLGIGGMSVILCMQWIFFPKFFHGPLADVDPELMALLWNQVAETQPLVSASSWQYGPFILYLGIALPAIPYLIWLIWEETNVGHRFFWVMIGIGVCLFFPLAFNEIRWVSYAELLILLPYTHLIGRILQRVVNRLPTPGNEVAKICLVMVSSLWCLLVGVKMLEVQDSVMKGTARKNCPIMPLSQYLNDPTGLGSREQVILAFVDFGPELLYRTSHYVISTPYHRNMEGNLDAYRILSDSDGDTAKTLLRTRQVDLIVTCPSSSIESSFFQAPNGEESFYDRLDQGDLPPWVHQITLPDSLAENFKVFQVRSSQERLI